MTDKEYNRLSNWLDMMNDFREIGYLIDMSGRLEYFPGPKYDKTYTSKGFGRTEQTFVITDSLNISYCGDMERCEGHNKEIDRSVLASTYRDIKTCSLSASLDYKAKPFIPRTWTLYPFYPREIHLYF